VRRTFIRFKNGSESPDRATKFVRSTEVAIASVPSDLNVSLIELVWGHQIHNGPCGSSIDRVSNRPVDSIRHLAGRREIPKLQIAFERY
jgi:hypothetical protein